MSNRSLFIVAGECSFSSGKKLSLVLTTLASAGTPAALSRPLPGVDFGVVSVGCTGEASRVRVVAGPLDETPPGTLPGTVVSPAVLLVPLAEVGEAVFELGARLLGDEDELVVDAGVVVFEGAVVEFGDVEGLLVVADVLGVVPLPAGFLKLSHSSSAGGGGGGGVF
jgi:hypothetical protein